MRIKQLDGLRGVLSFIVVLHHLPPEFTPNYIYFNFFLREAYTFVDCFFVLSGFVIALKYSGINEMGGVLKFYIKRFLRLLPLHYFCLSVMFIYVLFSKLIFIKYFPNIFNNTFNYTSHVLPFLEGFLLTNSTPLLGNGMSPNVPSWSISAEIISYLAFGLIMLSGKYKNFVFTILIIFSAFLLMNESPRLFFSSGEYGFLRGLISFSAGYFVFIISKKTSGMRSFNSDIFVLVTPIVLWILYELDTTSNFGALFGMFIIPLLYGSLILSLISGDKGYFLNFLNSNIIQFLGKISYSLYLIHFVIYFFVYGPFLNLLGTQGFMIDSDLKKIIFILSNILLILLISSFTNRKIEFIGLKYFEKKISPDF
jgi:peptidoglycan/LPS O-acetylase OafA/YrhL